MAPRATQNGFAIEQSGTFGTATQNGRSSERRTVLALVIPSRDGRKDVVLNGIDPGRCPLRQSTRSANGHYLCIRHGDVKNGSPVNPRVREVTTFAGQSGKLGFDKNRSLCEKYPE